MSVNKNQINSVQLRGLQEILDKKQDFKVGAREIFILSIFISISSTLRPLYVAIFEKIYDIKEQDCPILYNFLLVIFLIIILFIGERIYSCSENNNKNCT